MSARTRATSEFQPWMQLDSPPLGTWNSRPRNSTSFTPWATSTQGWPSGGWITTGEGVGSVEKAEASSAAITTG